MRILFLGDIVGRSGRDGVKQHLPVLKERLKPDALIINVENSAAGFGVTLKLAQEFLALGATCLTGSPSAQLFRGNARARQLSSYPDGWPASSCGQYHGAPFRRHDAG